MNDIRLLEMVERYLQGELSEEEKILFQELRRTHPDVDQLVVEHHFFINQMERWGNKLQMFFCQKNAVPPPGENFLHNPV